jgi:hypothetical protein
MHRVRNLKPSLRLNLARPSAARAAGLLREIVEHTGESRIDCGSPDIGLVRREAVVNSGLYG